MIIPERDAEWAADAFIEYFEKITQVDQYFRLVKQERMNEVSPTLFGEKLEDALFSDFTMHPQEMDFEIIPVGANGLDNDYFSKLLNIVASHVIEDSIPGRELKWIIYEKNSKKIVGFIRFGSPTINSKPRNIWLGAQPDISLLNQHCAMGFIIIPSQPFGFNYLGGKLLALICCSHYARELVSKRFDKNICLFETTSLYGSSKISSQYDGLEPYMRYMGLTESKFLPLLHDDTFHKLHDRFTYLNNNKPLTENTASSKKLKRQTKMISIIRKSLVDAEKLQRFNGVIDSAFSVTQKKRFYMCNYGFSNVREVLTGQSTELIPGANYHKHDYHELIKRWKLKASKRYETLKSSGRLRTELEVWSNNMNIDVIR
jgi:hypothetical protein